MRIQARYRGMQARQRLAQSGRLHAAKAPAAAAGKVGGRKSPVNGPAKGSPEAKAAEANLAGISRHSSRALLDQLPTVQARVSVRVRGLGG